jgi:hypothetical protein
MKPSTIAKTFALAAVAALALSVAPNAKADDKGCTNSSLKGTFSDRDSGWIYTSATAPPIPFAGINVETFDGNGNISGTGTASVGGSVTAGPFTGTYTVNRDCTGTYTVQFPGLTVHAFFVIDDSESELQIIITDPGNVILCVARRQFPAGDWRQ